MVDDIEGMQRANLKFCQPGIDRAIHFRVCFSAMLTFNETVLMNQPKIVFVLFSHMSSIYMAYCLDYIGRPPGMFRAPSLFILPSIYV